MFEKILNSALNNEIDLKKLTKWLCNQDVDLDININQQEFITYFLNYIRNETSRYLQSSVSKPECATPKKKVPVFNKSCDGKLQSSFNKSYDSKPYTSHNKSHDIKHYNKSLDGRLSFVSYDGNNSIHTSTPNRKFNKSYTSSEASFNSTLDKNSSKHNITLENYLTDNVYKNKKKRKPRTSNSPNTSVENDEIKSVRDRLSEESEVKPLRNRFSVESEVKINDENRLEPKSLRFNKSESEINATKQIKPRRVRLSDINNIEEYPNLKENKKDDDVDRNPKKITLKNVSKSRRIKPTILTENNKISINNSNSFTFTEKNQEVTENISEWRKNILQKEKEKIAARNSDIIISSPKYIKNNLYITPKITLVTNMEKLNILIDLYTTLLDNNLILNILSEIHFISTLLLGNSDEDDTESNIFNTVHNCVYFASNVLKKQSQILSLLNRPTIKLLIDNERLKQFVPELINQLLIVYNCKVDRKLQNIFHYGQMSYISETDSRENFPTELSFHKFKKQRDLFYDILRQWEVNHNQPEWIFNVALKNKMNDLLMMHNDPANYYHLARLFKNQLLNSGTTNNDNDDLDKEMNMLDVSADKLSKLKTRLVTKENHSDHHSDFPNNQEFYKEFIKFSHTNTIFIKHVENCLADEIVTMEINFYTEELDTDCAGDTSNNNFISYLKSTKVLAKFLGYIEALPYKTDITTNEQILKSFLNVRKMWSPVINIEKHLTISINQKSILLTLPWLIEYLSQLDYISLQLPALKNVIEILFKIYFSKYLNIFSISCFLMKILIGSLFEINNFPRELFNEALLKYINNDFKIEEETTVIQLINEEVLYVCAPKILGLKMLLSSGSAPVCMRIIRPVTNIITDTEAQKQKDQKILEDNFLHTQSENTKHMIDFVSHRVASATIKILRKIYIEKSVKSTINKLNEYVEENMTEDIENMTRFIQNAIEKATTIAEKELLKIKSVCNEIINKIILERCSKSVPALLHHDVHELVAVTCVSIAVRKAKERVKDWMDRNITIALYMDPLTKELTKTPEENHKEPPQITTYKNIEEYSSVMLVSNNKKFILSIHENPKELTQDATEKTLDNIKRTVSARSDLGGTVKEAVYAEVLDMFIALTVNRPDLTENCKDRLLECIQLFITPEDIKQKLENKDEENKSKKGKRGHVKGNTQDKKRKKEKVINIINPRNIYFLWDSRNRTKSWDVYNNFILTLLDKKILLPKEFEEQILALFQTDYPNDMFNMMVFFLKELVDDYSKGGGSEDVVRAAACLTSYLANDF